MLDENIDNVQSDASSNSYQFDDDLTSSGSSSTSSSDSSSVAKASGNQEGGRFSDELFSTTIHAQFRTFYIDLKQSSNGKFIKISEKSRGRKTTIMMDEEDLDKMIASLEEVKKHL